MEAGLKFTWWERPREAVSGVRYVTNLKPVPPVSHTGPAWRIGYGPSNILIAEGAAIGLQIGRALFEAFERGDFDPALVAAFGPKKGAA